MTTCCWARPCWRWAILLAWAARSAAAFSVQSPAGKAGLRAGDEILQLNGKAPRNFMDFTSQLVEATDQREHSLVVQRGAERRTLSMRLVSEKSFFNADLIRKKL